MLIVSIKVNKVISFTNACSGDIPSSTLGLMGNDTEPETSAFEVPNVTLRAYKVDSMKVCLIGDTHCKKLLVWEILIDTQPKCQNI